MCDEFRFEAADGPGSLVAKIGQDGHDHGAKGLRVVFADMDLTWRLGFSGKIRGRVYNINDLCNDLYL